MLVLGLETATEQLGIALARDGRTIGAFALAEGLRHCERLLLGLDGLLADLDLDAGDLGGIAVSCGPGSFTGLRIGIAAAQGLALARGLPAVGVPTLDALVQAVRPWRGAVVGCLDARRGEVYFCAYRSDGRRVERCSEEGVGPAASFVERLPLAAGEPVCVIGDAVAEVGAALAGAGREVVPAPGSARFPQAVAVAALGTRLLAAAAGQPPERLRPLYLRRSDAELTREGSAVSGGA